MKSSIRQRTEARRIECIESGEYFCRYFYKQRTGAKMIISAHHRVILETLQKVINGEITRLIINVPPGYSKTEIATINFMCRGLAINNRSRFLHLSYSNNLALLNSSTARTTIKSRPFQDMWNMDIRADADSKSMWWNQYGGGVYATSTLAQVTGFRAGHMEDGFNGAMIIDDPLKPADAYSDVVRTQVNTNYNDTLASRLAVQTTPVIVIMQRIHYDDLSGYLLRGGSGEKWHHLNLPVKIDNSIDYWDLYPENKFAIPVPYKLDDGWLWPKKHNDNHEAGLKAHRRSFEAQYMQRPRKFDEEGALWTEAMITAAHRMQITQDKVRTVIAIDPATTSSDESDETGIVACSAYGGGKNAQYSVDGDYSGRMSPNDWAQASMNAYNIHEADAIVIETNQGGEMAEATLRNAGFKGRIVKVHASKGKFARAEPISALYAQGRVAHTGELYTLENQMMEYVPATAKKSPDRMDAMVWGITELSQPQAMGLMLPKRLRGF
ncbi:phage terminase large subunit family protein [Escherichia coli]|uniref:phage terminase large subunit family protein n=1 Tax=Escherichia coli TaxID=562 RepID=UPI003F90B1EF